MGFKMGADPEGFDWGGPSHWGLSRRLLGRKELEKMFRLRDDLKAIFTSEPARLEEVEKSISATISEFPKDLKEFYNNYDGGWMPAGVSFPFWEIAENGNRMSKPGTRTLTAFFSCKPPMNQFPYTYQEFYSKDHRPYVSAPAWLRPIGVAIDRALVCFSTREWDRGRIYSFCVEGATEDFEFDQEEYSPDDWVYFVADNFQSFVNELRLE